MESTFVSVSSDITSTKSFSSSSNFMNSSFLWCENSNKSGFLNFNPIFWHTTNISCSKSVRTKGKVKVKCLKKIKWNDRFRLCCDSLLLYKAKFKLTIFEVLLCKSEGSWNLVGYTSLKVYVEIFQQNDFSQLIFQVYKLVFPYFNAWISRGHDEYWLWPLI